MTKSFQVDHLDVDRLLTDWRWLCPQPVTLVARSAFGDLFLQTNEGKVLWLDVTFGKLTEVAESVVQFRELLESADKREEWFAEADEKTAADNGLKPNPNQCIGYATPLIFAESGYAHNAYVADLYDHIGFLGDLHKQVSTLPDGTKVEFRVSPTKRSE
jgi:hypothetical protein